MDIENQELIEYFKSKKEVIAIYLFGSYAVGKQRHMSDIDIGILMSRTGHDFTGRKINEYIVELSRILRKDIHPVILNFASEELLKQIFKKGKCILINDSKKLSINKMIMFAKISDWDYYRRRMQSGLIKNIMGG